MKNLTHVPVAKNIVRSLWVFDSEENFYDHVADVGNRMNREPRRNRPLGSHRRRLDGSGLPRFSAERLSQFREGDQRPSKPPRRLISSAGWI